MNLTPGVPTHQICVSFGSAALDFVDRPVEGIEKRPLMSTETAPRHGSSAPSQLPPPLLLLWG
jgi:hypothetical protein